MKRIHQESTHAALLMGYSVDLQSQKDSSASSAFFQLSNSLLKSAIKMFTVVEVRER